MISLLDHRWRPAPAAALFAVLLALPFIAQALNEGFYVGLASRVLIFALAATSLNLILGFGGMVSFGHAAFVGVGAYSVAILMQHGVESAWIAWPLAVLMSAAFALVIGAISLRTKGVYFIMITLAFAQMLFYVAVSLKAYGGEDGLALAARSTIVRGMDMANDTVFYYVVLGVAALAFAGVQRLLNARFGHALQAIRENETRMAAIGYPVYRHKLAAFTLAGAIAGLAGVLAANQSGFVSPSLLQWSQSGMLMMMVILGGIGHLYGGIVGAAVFLLLEEVLSAHTIHWQFALGAVLLAVVLAAPHGLAGLVRRRTNP
ncbi:branched-chain amino acid ABC transporter permease [Ramlibacter sp. WS9]|uniref:branched-chain amino acid ABC transporter permease n=1 Tax=Ramlibacter sp. WS9 TaxID=1882741 RepID=UPI001142E12D|nr:branched-chain amino acid ABC transporter permease [Ramlibacter sp. WS9]ROZ74422.1 branched-chain amino acid ABC transporter permease [Ramlibacter sp. WS9]